MSKIKFLISGLFVFFNAFIIVLGQNVTLTTTNLPLVIINTNGLAINSNSKIKAQMKIIFNTDSKANHPTDSPNIYTGNIGIEEHGSSSLSYPQKSYSLETRDDLGNNLNVPILDMPSDNDWLLIQHYNDNTLMKNALSFNLFEKMGHYQPRVRYCEVILNNVYAGVYILTEKIKQGKNRVDIANLKLTDNAGDSLTGGYIFKIDNSSGSDGWSSTYDAIDRPGSFPYFIYNYPKVSDITSQQQKYLQAFIASFDKELRNDDFADPIHGYRAYADVNSFMDYFIVGEVSRNVDAYKKSAYFNKNKDSNGGLIHAGPVWDFDWAWKNMSECIVDNTDGSGWSYQISSVCHSNPVPPGWVSKFLEDPTFADALKTRYVDLRKTLLSEESLYSFIDSIQNLLKDAKMRHYRKWEVDGVSTSSTDIDVNNNYTLEIHNFEDWISTREAWLDDNMPGNYITVNTKIKKYNFTYILFPNPAIDKFYVESTFCIKKLELYNNTGMLVKSKLVNNLYSTEMELTDISSGLYFAKIEFNDGHRESVKLLVH